MIEYIVEHANKRPLKSILFLEMSETDTDAVVPVLLLLLLDVFDPLGEFGVDKFPPLNWSPARAAKSPVLTKREMCVKTHF